MKKYQRHFILLVFAMTMGTATCVLANDKKPAPPAASRSIFIIPHNPSQGRDPFFPKSTRVYQQFINRKAKTKAEPAIPPLTVYGISGIPGHLLSIINNHTFAAGDSGDILTPNGRKVRIHCLEVHENFVVVEVNGHVTRLKVGKL